MSTTAGSTLATTWSSVRLAPDAEPFGLGSAFELDGAVAAGFDSEVGVTLEELPWSCEPMPTPRAPAARMPAAARLGLEGGAGGAGGGPDGDAGGGPELADACTAGSGSAGVVGAWGT